MNKLLSSTLFILLSGLFVLCSIPLRAQVSLSHMNTIGQGLKLRAIGPATMGGRISDIVVNPQNSSNWYVSAGSGGVWKTMNRGITWTPVFDDQPSYSIGCLALDPKNPTTVWVGTGENVSGRHVGWGDGVYKSTDGGNSWQNMGLGKSEHIGKILIDPRNSSVVFVASEGPLWSSGGERGLYRSSDGGKTWTRTLFIDDNTGVTDVEFDPSNPEVLYAAAYERRRKTWSLLAGGVNSGIYKSVDNGKTWRKLTKGLPRGEMGKIGLAVTPADPSRVYATIEAQDQEKGFYRSDNKGESWKKMNTYISGGTGPHYYQEIEASPTDPNLVYQNDVFIHVTRDGGNTFDYLGTGREKHSDNHALWIDPHNGEHLIAGCDGGLYESYDQGATWRFFDNLPIAQFYKIALDNAQPYYNVVAGAQDLGTLIGPSRTLNTEGIRNQDWYVPLGADGYDAAFDPKDPHTVYMEIQGGELYRLNRKTEEVVSIKPVPGPNDPPERFNWDAPVVVSHHDNHTLYFGSQRVWKSTDRGNSWTPISDDLTTNTNRYTLSMQDNVPSVNALYDNGAMSLYATLTNIAESSVKKGVLFAGSDDGLVHVSENDGQSWTQTKSFPGVPERSFINDLEASPHNEDEVFAAVDAHKLGNYSPFLFKSTNKGRSWQSISGDLPSNVIVWSIKQDAVDENLLFIGAEDGMYFSQNKGLNWVKLSQGVPTIPFRDIELHPETNDLVGGSFGRGVYVLDDYSILRNMNRKLDKNGVLAARDAYWYVPSVPLQAKGMPSQGSNAFRIPNPEFGAMIRYVVKDMPVTRTAHRMEREKTMRSTNITFPGWNDLSEENSQRPPEVYLLISDNSGNPMRWLKGRSSVGVHTVTWDLRMPAPNAVSLSKPAFQPPWAGDPEGPMVAPGNYQVQMYTWFDGNLSKEGESQAFEVNPIPILKQHSEDIPAMMEFNTQATELYRKMVAESRKLGDVRNQLRFMKAALLETPKADENLYNQFAELESLLQEQMVALMGDRTRASFNEASVPSTMTLGNFALRNSLSTTEAPTTMNKESYQRALVSFETFLNNSGKLYSALEAFKKKLIEAGAPYTPGRY